MKLRETRQEEAIVRKEKVEALNQRLGKNIGATKERAKLKGE